MKSKYGTHGMDSLTDFIWQNVLGVSGEDDSLSDGFGSGMALVGKRILVWDDHGFASTERYASASEASETFTERGQYLCTDDEYDSLTTTQAEMVALQNDKPCPLHPGHYHSLGSYACEIYSGELFAGTE